MLFSTTLRRRSYRSKVSGGTISLNVVTNDIILTGIQSQLPFRSNKKRPGDKSPKRRPPEDCSAHYARRRTAAA